MRSSNGIVFLFNFIQEAEGANVQFHIFSLEKRCGYDL